MEDRRAERRNGGEGSGREWRTRGGEAASQSEFERTLPPRHASLPRASFAVGTTTRGMRRHAGQGSRLVASRSLPLSALSSTLTGMKRLLPLVIVAALLTAASSTAAPSAVDDLMIDME